MSCKSGLDPEGLFTGGGGGSTSSPKLEPSGTSRERGESMSGERGSLEGVRGSSPEIFLKYMSLSMHFKPFLSPLFHIL